MVRRPSAWTVLCPEGSASSELVILGIQREGTEVVVRIAPLEGDPVMAGLSLGNESVPLNLSSASASGGGFGHWVRLGVEHILIGADHLLFVLGLVLLIATTRQLLVTITSFTLAHSITLGGASLGYFSLPSAPVEAVIALSIVLLAVELIRPYRDSSAPGLSDPPAMSLSRRKPWLVAFVFGLLHGFGFAGVLGELGLPQDAIWMPLLAFNVGVELGQLSFVALIFLPTVWLRKAPDLVRQLPAYAIGTVAAAWTLERVASFWGS
jgi:hydrogenase/urease accessory protein HupE